LPTFPSFLLMSIFQINSYTLFRCIAISGQDKCNANGELKIENGEFIWNGEIGPDRYRVENGELNSSWGFGRVVERETFGIAVSVKSSDMDVGFVRGSRSYGEVGYLDADGRIILVRGWPMVGRELKVWALEDLLPAARLERNSLNWLNHGVG
jgi:hypothetical protein